MPVLFSQAPNIVTSPQADFQVTDDLDIGDDAAIGGDLTVGATLAVTGTTTLTGAVNTVADLTVGDDLVVTDDASVGGDLGVTGALAVTGAITASNGVILPAGKDVTIDGAGAGSKLGQSGSKIGVFGATPIVQPTALTVALTTVTCSAPGTPDYAIAAPVQNTGYGFSTADEMLSVLKALANAQARIGELETKLTAFGLLHT